VLIGIALGLVGAVVLVLSVATGTISYTPGEVIEALFGGGKDSTQLVVQETRLPRALTALLAGGALGASGAILQSVARNPLASPDIIGISRAASAAAVLAIVVLGLDGPVVSIFAVIAGLGVALLIYGLSFQGGVAGTRLILVGIGVSAMLDSFIAYVLTRAPSWDLAEAMRWLTGSVNGAQLSQALPMLASLAVFGGLLVSRSRDLESLRLGDDTAAALGTNVAATRMLVILSAVGLIAVATAITGPVAFVAFLSGPIAARILGPNGSVLIPSGLVGALLVLGGDYIGQFLLPTRFPVGVVIGALGAPYLIWLIVRVNRAGGSL
jgi:iron complex transport system permease protein